MNNLCCYFIDLFWMSPMRDHRNKLCCRILVVWWIMTHLHLCSYHLWWTLVDIMRNSCIDRNIPFRINCVCVWLNCGRISIKCFPLKWIFNWIENGDLLFRNRFQQIPKSIELCRIVIDDVVLCFCVFVQSNSREMWNWIVHWAHI